MTQHLVLGAYWGPREEQVEACAARLDDWIERIGAVEPRLASWLLPAGRADDAAPLPRGDALAAHLVQRRSASDGDLVPADAGFALSGWSAGGGRFDARLGESSAHLGNSVVLRIPDAVTQGLTLQVSLDLLAATVQGFEPRLCMVVDRAAARAQARRTSDPYVGWLTYLDRPVRSVAAADSVSPLAQGTVLVATGEARDADAERLTALRDELLSVGVDLRRAA